MKKVRLYLMKYFLFPSFSLRGSGEGRRVLSLSLSFLLIFSLLPALCGAQPLPAGTPAPCGTVLPGFSESPYFREQVMSFVYNPDIKVHINAPSAERFDAAKPVKLVLYALPNGNSTDWTIGKLPAQGDDWHYFIQHIGAQTRYLRQADTTCNWVTVYLEARQKTRQKLEIKWEKQMQEIVDRHHVKSSRYLLPILSEDGGDIRRQYLNALHRVNVLLKKIGKMVNCPIPLTTYTARHCWASTAYRLNIPTPSISQALGHDSEKTTRIYLNSLDNRVIDDANLTVIRAVYA